MDGARFAYELSTWLQPGIIARVAEEAGSPDADEPITLRCNAPTLKHASDAGLDKLCDLYLDNFSIPEGLLSIAALYRPSLPRTVWTELSEMKFTGSRAYGTTASDSKITSTIEIVAPLREARLLQWPLTMLTKTVDGLHRYWSGVLGSHEPSDIHHESRAEWSFLAFLDATVMRAVGLGHLANPGLARRDIYRLHRDARFRSATGPLPVSRQDLAMLQASLELGLGEAGFVDYDISQGGRND